MPSCSTTWRSGASTSHPAGSARTGRRPGWTSSAYRGTCLRLGAEAVVEVTGLRNPCRQIEAFRTGLLEEVLGRAPDGSVVRRAGVMAVVLVGGTVHRDDPVVVVHPAGPTAALTPV